jgi:hypothetical protein
MRLVPRGTDGSEHLTQPARRRLPRFIGYDALKSTLFVPIAHDGAVRSRAGAGARRACPARGQGMADRGHVSADPRAHTGTSPATVPRGWRNPVTEISWSDFSG